jgi:hypothetical protein
MQKLLLLVFISLFGAACQDFGKLTILHSLPSQLEEISGIEMASEGTLLWAVTDSGNEAKLFLYNPERNTIVSSIAIANGKNRDWEDIAVDTDGTVFIGDFGNNNNLRKNLTIYAVPDAIHQKEGDVEAVITSFRFEDQTKFPPKKKDRNFDVEAFVHFQGNFYLFTRNRSSNFDGTTKLYKVPAKEGNFTATLIDTYVTCDDEDDCMVTGAAMDPTTGTLALLSYNKVWLFSAYTEDHFFDGTLKKIKLEHSSQKESICFLNSNTLLIADEQNGSEGGNLYKLIIQD